MKKVIIVSAAIIALGVAGCASVGKYPVGKAPAPVVTKG